MPYCEITDLDSATCAHCTTAVGDKLDAIRSLAHELMEEHGLTAQGWTFKFDKTRRRVGVCRHDIRVIGFSELWQGLPMAKVRNTILHEVAHALVGPHHGHDLVWQTKAVSIGCDGKACVSDVREFAPVDPWVGTCPGCSDTVGQSRAPLNVKACSSCCQGRFNPKFAYVWRKNGSKAAMPKRFMDACSAIEKRYGVVIPL